MQRIQSHGCGAPIPVLYGQQRYCAAQLSYLLDVPLWLLGSTAYLDLYGYDEDPRTCTATRVLWTMGPRETWDEKRLLDEVVKEIARMLCSLIEQVVLYGERADLPNVAAHCTADINDVNKRMKLRKQFGSCDGTEPKGLLHGAELP